MAHGGLILHSMMTIQSGFRSGSELDILDLFHGSLAVISAKGTLLRCNGDFAEFLNRGDTLVCDEHLHLCFQSALDHEAFRAALVRCKPTAFFTGSGSSEQAIVTLTAPKLSDKDLAKAPFQKDESRGGPLLMWIRPRQRERMSAEFLRDLFGLTPAETRITEYVIQGLTLEEGAKKIGISKNHCTQSIDVSHGQARGKPADAIGVAHSQHVPEPQDIEASVLTALDGQFGVVTLGADCDVNRSLLVGDFVQSESLLRRTT